jgi:hypothetical protein
VAVDEYDYVYPNLAVFSNSSEIFAVYHRFGYLQTRLLLDKEDELRVLEQKLHLYDDTHSIDSHTRALDAEVIGPRNAVLKEIEGAFNAYGILAQYPTSRAQSSTDYAQQA